MGKKAEEWYKDPKKLQARIEEYGGFASASRATGIAESTLKSAWNTAGLPPRGRTQTATIREPADLTPTEEQESVLTALNKLGQGASIEELADASDLAPRRVRDALDVLGYKGYRIEQPDNGGRVQLHRVPPPSDNIHAALFEGDQIRVGIISDTHLGSKEEALDELNLAYDICADEGIKQIWHPGDISTGVEIFGKKQHSEANVHTLDDAVEYVVEYYPKRPGITTRLIGGNHDLEGLAGRSGFDIAQAVANRRTDIEYLGPFEAWVETRPETGRFIQMLHPKGGMSYSWSYKAQKIVDAYPGGRKPVALILGHWHVKGNIRARDVEVLWAGCFEWQSQFMARLGLNPAVGFHILEMTIADDGSIVKFTPTWYPFHPGRTVNAPQVFA